MKTNLVERLIEDDDSDFLPVAAWMVEWNKKAIAQAKAEGESSIVHPVSYYKIKVSQFEKSLKSSEELLDKLRNKKPINQRERSALMSWKEAMRKWK